MGFFPQLSNVYPELQELLESRANNSNAPWNNQDVYKGGVSGLSTWIRIVSTVDRRIGNGISSFSFNI